MIVRGNKLQKVSTFRIPKPVFQTVEASGYKFNDFKTRNFLACLFINNINLYDHALVEVHRISVYGSLKVLFYPRLEPLNKLRVSIQS